jgi:hypothetical protein
VRAQYAASSDPEVVAAAQRNQDGRRAALLRCSEWAQAHGSNDAGSSTGFYPRAEFGGAGVYSIPITEGEPPKGWVRAGKGWRPRKGSPAYREMEALRWTPEPVPGLPDWFTAPRGAPGETWMLWAVPVVWDGQAWVLLGHMPTEGEFGPQWREVRASEAHAAREAYLDARKAGELP